MDHPVQYRNKAQVPVRHCPMVRSNRLLSENSHDLMPIEDLYPRNRHDPSGAWLSSGIWFVVLTSSPMMSRNSLAWFRFFVVRRGHHSGNHGHLVTTRPRCSVWTSWSSSWSSNFQPSNPLCKYQRPEYQCYFGKNGGRFMVRITLLTKCWNISKSLDQPFIRSIPGKWQSSIRQLLTLPELREDDVVIDASGGTIGLSVVSMSRKSYGLRSSQKQWRIARRMLAWRYHQCPLCLARHSWK